MNDLGYIANSSGMQGEDWELSPRVTFETIWLRSVRSEELEIVRSKFRPNCVIHFARPNRVSVVVRQRWRETRDAFLKASYTRHRTTFSQTWSSSHVDIFLHSATTTCQRSAPSHRLQQPDLFSKASPPLQLTYTSPSSQNIPCRLINRSNFQSEQSPRRLCLSYWSQTQLSRQWLHRRSQRD